MTLGCREFLDVLLIILRGKKMNLILEIRAAEGGNDSKLLTGDMARMYLKAADKNNVHADLFTSLDSL